MPNFQLGDTQQVAFTITEFDGKGNPAVPQAGDTFTSSLSNSSAATVTFDSPPKSGSASGVIVAQQEQLGLVLTIALQHISGPAITITDTIDIVGGPASTIGISLGTPTAQVPPAGPPAGP